MKSININRNNTFVNIIVSVELDVRKSQLFINQKKVESRFNNILKKVSKFSKFANISLNYEQLDYHDDVVRVYETPYFYFRKGENKRKPTIMSTEHMSIPKGWIETISLTLENPKTIKPIEVFLSDFNISLTPKEVKDVRKAMKGETRYYKTF